MAGRGSDSRHASASRTTAAARPKAHGDARKTPSAFDQIHDPIDRALVKEWAHLAAIHDRLVEIGNDRPYMERRALSVELNDWMAKNSHLSVAQKLRKLDERFRANQSRRAPAPQTDRGEV